MSHPRHIAETAPERAAVIFADTGETLTYGDLEHRANQAAQMFRSLGVKNGDTLAIWLPNSPEYFEVYWAAQRSGLHITPISTALSAEEAAYILEDSHASILIGGAKIRGLADMLRAHRPQSLSHVYIVGEGMDELPDWRTSISAFPPHPIEDEQAGFQLVYSSGTTGRPKGIRQALSGGPATDPSPLSDTIRKNFGIGEDTIYLSPAPLYHAAPLGFTTSCHRLGATTVILRKFDPEEALKAIERYKVTNTQMVPTMFVRMLRLENADRLKYDLSSLVNVVHAAAPCPVDIKRKMIEWMGPIIDEYYSGSEGNGSTYITSEEWLKKPGSVGRASWGTIHICDDDGNELPPGEQGVIYFDGGWEFQYLNDPEKTREARHPQHPTWATLGDIGYMDEDGYLFLTDRKTFMIISGGVNIYPQEIEDLLISHPKIMDAAVVGAPNSEMGEEVRAVVQPVSWDNATPEFAEELIAYCRDNLSHIKCPRVIDFDPQLPRLDNGKLYKRHIRDRYWAGHDKRIN